MRKTLLTLFLSVIFHNIFAQTDSLLKNFKYRISHYRIINFDLGTAGSFSNTDYPAGTNKTNGASGNFGISGYYTKSTDRILLESSAGVSAGVSFGRNKSTSNENKYKNSSGYASFNILNKWFQRKFFTELGAEGSLDFFNFKANVTNQLSDAQNNQSDYTFTLHTGIGNGRLENITDMQNALWLDKALSEENKFSRSLSAGELNELGRMITTANNTRVLDSRKKTQFILESIDNYFQKKGLINVTDIRYFSNLNDVLFFAFNNQRLSGTEKFIRFTPAITYFLRDNVDHAQLYNLENRITTESARLSIGINRYHPVNLRHQNDVGASIFLNYIKQHEREKDFNAGIPSPVLDFTSDIKQAGINLFSRHSIYPNTRTNIIFDLSSETGYEDIGITGFYSSNNLTGVLNYFISYRTRLNCSLGATYLKGYNRVYPDFLLIPDTWQISANAGIAISL